MHRHRHMCSVSVVVTGQSMAHSSLERCHQTLCYCKNKMHTALEGLYTVAVDLTNYTVGKSIPDLGRRMDDSSASGVGS